MEGDGAREPQDEMLSSDESLISDENSAEIQNAQAELAEHPTFEAHSQLVSVLRREGSDLSALRKARESFAAAFPLSPSLWIEWADDELRIAATRSEREFVANSILRKGLGDYLSCPIASKLLHLEIERFKLGELSFEDVKAGFLELYDRGACMHFTEGAKLWKLYREFLNDTGDHADDELFVSREEQRIPLRDNQRGADTANGSSNSSIKDSEQFPNQQVLNEHKESCEIFEGKLLETGSDYTIESGVRSDEMKMHYLSYATFVEKIDFRIAASVWERCIQECFLDGEIWKKYVAFYESHHQLRNVLKVLKRAVRNVPWDLKIWRALICNVVRLYEESDISHPIATKTFLEFLHRARGYVFTSSDWDGAMDLCRAAFACYHRLNLPEEARDPVLDTLNYTQHGSVQWCSCKCFVASLCEARGDRSSSIKHMEEVVATRGKEVRWWVSYIRLLSRPGNEQGLEIVRDVFRRGMEQLERKDHVSLLSSFWVEFESTALTSLLPFMNVLNSTDERYSVLSSVGQEFSRRENKRNQLVSTKPAEKETEAFTDLGKRKMPPTAKKRKRNAAAPAEKSRGESEGQDKIDAKGSPNTSRGHRVGDAESELNVYETNTIYINNLTFRANEDDIRNVFMKAGSIKDIRIPKRADGASKGIAYVEYEDMESTLRALELHNSPVRGRSVWVRRSKPPKDRGRGRKKDAAAKTKRKQMPSRHKPRLILTEDAIRRDVDDGALQNNNKAMNQPVAQGGNSNMVDIEGGTVPVKSEPSDKDIPKVTTFKSQADFRSMFFSK